MTDSSPPTSCDGEFALPGAAGSDRRGPLRWLLSHLLRHKGCLARLLLGSTAAVGLNAGVPALTGRAFDVVLAGGAGQTERLGGIVLALLALVLLRGSCSLTARISSEMLASRLERDTRDELYRSLLGKSQTFHNRQRVGDLMARTSGDVRQLNMMISPGLDLIVDSLLQGLVPMLAIALLDPRLLPAPLFFAAAFVVSVRRYLRRLGPVSSRLRQQFGTLNAGLNEAIRGIELVKGSAQEGQELRRFSTAAGSYRDLFVEQGRIQGRYLPPLLLAVATAGALLHGLVLHRAGELSIGGLVQYLGLMALLGFPAGVSLFSFSLLQLGLASARRILELLGSECELARNDAGHQGPVHGEIVFEQVSFGYGAGLVLRDLSFRIAPGRTVAIVGETGSGKSTLGKLVNRIHDVRGGRILVDGIDVRDWNLDALRSGVSCIEQDIVLFSRTVAENIAFSTGQRAGRDEVEQAAREARAHDFIMALPQGYDTVIGERGLTLSGGQRQRLAIARALLTAPGILILDDATSAIDSATEDEIQEAIRRILQGRTTLLITHRLSQIRQADQVLLLARGELVDCGSHQELLARCPLYRRIFAGGGTTAAMSSAEGTA
ncbi:MAG: ABC transporter [Desulfobulbaceae bacterium A2]|nr:MAG: ABC transporter [Desulfobulbaceae bacterium A2]